MKEVAAQLAAAKAPLERAGKALYYYYYYYTTATLLTRVPFSAEREVRCIPETTQGVAAQVGIESKR